MDSHLLPKSLTKAEGLGPGLIQHGSGRKTKRFSSWYDKRLVTEAGESILERIDDRGIALLRKYKLIWSGWGPMSRLISPDDNVSDGGTQRVVTFDCRAEADEIRLFLLSILWRAAATDRPEFSEIELAEKDLEKLRAMVVQGATSPLYFFPSTLIQLSTIGLRHNHAPIAQTKWIPAVKDIKEREEPIFRFYFDGLIVHFSRLPPTENMELGLERFWVGGEEQLSVLTVPFHQSAQLDNLRIVMAEGELGRPLWELGRGAFDR